MSPWDRVSDALAHLVPRNLLYSTYEARLLADLDRTHLPQHIAVLADGNRRWARLNAPGQPLVAGYRAGANKLKEFVKWCSDAGVGRVTLWVLSTDNLGRATAEELEPLLGVIEDLVHDLAQVDTYRVQAVGALDLLPEKTAANLRRNADSTIGRSGMHINVAVSYGGRHELADAVRSLLADQAAKGATLDEVAETLEIDQIAEHLYTKGQPDPDLIIRTSGEQRLSGFLMWQSAHSEFYFCEALWPDFRRIDFVRALRAFTQRERRFGR